MRLADKTRYTGIKRKDIFLKKPHNWQNTHLSALLQLPEQDPKKVTKKQKSTMFNVVVDFCFFAEQRFFNCVTCCELQACLPHFSLEKQKTLGS